MFVNGEIKEHVDAGKHGNACLRGKREAEREYSESVSYKCYKGKAETEIIQMARKGQSKNFNHRIRKIQSQNI